MSEDTECGALSTVDVDKFADMVANNYYYTHDMTATDVFTEVSAIASRQSDDVHASNLAEWSVLRTWISNQDVLTFVDGLLGYKE